MTLSSFLTLSLREVHFGPWLIDFFDLHDVLNLIDLAGNDSIRLKALKTTKILQKLNDKCHLKTWTNPACKKNVHIRQRLAFTCASTIYLNVFDRSTATVFVIIFDFTFQFCQHFTDFINIIVQVLDWIIYVHKFDVKMGFGYGMNERYIPLKDTPS